MQIQHHLPKAYPELEIFCDILPLHERSPAHPLGAMVVNLCACTIGHRDTIDRLWCSTFTFGDPEGGEICFYELGLVFDSRPGNMLVFHSQRETHFNLHMKGVRGALVLHSDRVGDKWADNYNRWSAYVN